MDQPLLARIEHELEQRKPSVYFVVDFDSREVTVGLIDAVSCDYLIEPEVTDIDYALQLSEQFGEAESMYYKVINDDRDSLPRAEWQTEVEAMRALPEPVAPPLTCSLSDAIEFLVEAAKRGSIEVNIDGARWLVQR